jgi:hypothetical protein
MGSASTFKEGAWHGLIEAGGQFPPEKGRYHLYIGSRIFLSISDMNRANNSFHQDSFAHSHTAQTSSAI